MEYPLLTSDLKPINHEEIDWNDYTISSDIGVSFPKFETYL